MTTRRFELGLRNNDTGKTFNFDDDHLGSTRCATQTTTVSTVRDVYSCTCMMCLRDAVAASAVPVDSGAQCRDRAATSTPLGTLSTSTTV